MCFIGIYLYVAIFYYYHHYYYDTTELFIGLILIIIMVRVLHGVLWRFPHPATMM